MGLFDSVSSLASAAAPITNLIPGGGIFNSAVSVGTKLGSFLGGLFNKPTLDHERPDIIRIADATGLTQRQAEDLCGMEEQRSPDAYDHIVKKYADNPQGLLPLISEWNQKHPDRPITAAAPVVPAVVVQSPVVSAAPIPAVVNQSLASNLTGQDVKDLGGSIIKGAQNGATEWAMNTPQGQAAKAEGFKSWLKDNQLYVFTAALAVAGLIYKAFFAKK